MSAVPLPAGEAPRRRAVMALSPYERLTGWLLRHHPLLWRSQPVLAVSLAAVGGLLVWLARDQVPTDPGWGWNMERLETSRLLAAQATLVAMIVQWRVQQRYATGELSAWRQFKTLCFSLVLFSLIGAPYVGYDRLVSHRVSAMLSLAEADQMAARYDEWMPAFCDRLPEDQLRLRADRVSDDLRRFRLHPAPEEPDIVHQWAKRLPDSLCPYEDEPGYVSIFDHVVASQIALLRGQVAAIRREQGHWQDEAAGTPRLRISSWWLVAMVIALSLMNTQILAPLQRVLARWLDHLTFRHRHQGRGPWGMPALVRRFPTLWTFAPGLALAWAFGASVAGWALKWAVGGSFSGDLALMLATGAAVLFCPLLIARMAQWRPPLHAGPSWRAVLLMALCTFLAAVAGAILCGHRPWSWDRASTLAALWILGVLGSLHVLALVIAALLGAAMSRGQAWGCFALGLFAFAIALVNHPPAPRWSPSLAWLAVCIGLWGLRRFSERSRTGAAMLAGLAAALVPTVLVTTANVLATVVSDRSEEDGLSLLHIAIVPGVALLAVLLMRVTLWPTLERYRHAPRRS